MTSYQAWYELKTGRHGGMLGFENPIGAKTPSMEPRFLKGTI